VGAFAPGSSMSGLIEQILSFGSIFH
jgi:hypothetical protein